LFLLKTIKALNGLLCADVPLKNCSLTHALTQSVVGWVKANLLPKSQNSKSP